MVLDYRNTRFSFRKLRRRRRMQRFRWLLLLLFLSGIVLLTISFNQHRRLAHIQAGLLTGDPSAATELEQHPRPLFTRTAMVELEALSRILSGQFAKGEKILSSASHSSAVNPERFLQRMLDTGRYAALRAYLDFLEKDGHPNPYYRIICHTAFYDPVAARESAAALSPELRGKNTKALKIMSDLWRRMDSGKITCIHDLSGRPVGDFDLKKKVVISRIPGLDLEPFTPRLRSGLRFFTLTLDSGLQQKIHRLFNAYHGSFVVLSPGDNAIRVAYSKPISGKTGNTAFTQRYEPGSVIKTLTFLAFMHAPDTHLFPLNCPGMLQLGEKTFRDWRTHGRIDSATTGLVVSCNIAYARMGLAVGMDILSKTFTRFLFNHSDLHDGPLDLRMGTFSSPPLDDYAGANLSVGLEEVTLTTLHGALLASTISQSGSLARPHLIATEKNILQLGIYHKKSEILSRIPDSRRFQQLREAMTRVVTDPRGTGRRALVKSAPIPAIKTGTAGDPDLGLDAVIIGFTPSRKPEMAFAFRLERGGKAEIHGARILKAFISLPDESR